MKQRKVIGSRQCTGGECENVIPVYESRGNGNVQPQLCWPCKRARRLATNRRVAKKHRSELAAPADVRDPVFNVTGGFQHSTVAQIIRDWTSWQRGESEMV